MILAETAAALPWAQFGLAGLVIGALFAVLWHFMKQHREEREKTSESHRDERREWRAEATSREERLQEIFKSFTEAVLEADQNKG